MRLYAAPMEGLTGHVWRSAHRACFPGVDAYYAPFIAPNRNHCLSAREARDLLPENNAGVPLIPQILTGCADDFNWAAGVLRDMGYTQVDLNLGCPSPTVVTKGKGSGMLADPDALDRFLEGIFAHAVTGISIKTRLGVTDENLFPRILRIFEKYPVTRLVIHPRIQADMYKRPVRPQAFETALSACHLPVVYNGDVFDPAAAKAVPGGCEGLMAGRGLIANPALSAILKGLPAPETKVLKTFHDMLAEGYKAVMPGDRALMFKLKEVWLYMGCLFEDRGDFDKKLKKAARLSDYEALTGRLFSEYEPSFERFFKP